MTIANALNLNTTANQIIYMSSAATFAGIPVVNNAVLVTSAGGVPSESLTLPNAVQDNITRLGTIASIGAPLGAQFGGTGITNLAGSTITLGGALSTIGAFTSAFTMTGNTTVTFPTTGTLATVSGTISAINGTPNQIDVNTVATVATVSIDAGYVGQTSITTLGTIGTGVWAGTNVALNHGGTNAALTASNGGIVWSNATQLQILAGTATSRQMLQSGSSATPAWSTATWPATTTINQILYSSGANTVTGLATANQSVLTTGTTGIPVLTSIATDGQIIIGSTAGAPAAATLTPGTGIGILNASNSITISVSGAGFSFVDQTGAAVTMAPNTTYMTDNAGLITFTVPALVARFTIFEIVGFSAGGWLLQFNGGQVGNLNSSATSAGGSFASTNRNNCIKIMCTVANTTFTVISSSGSITFA